MLLAVAAALIVDESTGDFFMRHVVWALAAVCLLTFGTAHGAAAKEVAQLSDIAITSLAVEVVDADADFEVVDARMDETATAAVFFGLVGATINSANNNAEDDKKEAPLNATADAIDMRALVARALMERLTARTPQLLAASPEAASHRLVVRVGEWGLVRRGGKPDTAMRPFVKLNVSVVDARGRVVWGPQRDHSVGQMAAELSAFTPEVFKTEIEALAARAGQQVANRMIYR